MGDQRKVSREELEKAAGRDQPDFQNCDLSGLDLGGADLKGFNLSRASLRGANLRGANLKEAYLLQADLTEADLREVDLEGAILWEADVSRADGRFSEVYVDPKTGEIFDEHSGRALLTTEQVLARAQSHGLREIHSLERDGATWSLEARNARNQKVEVRLSGHDGRILHSERDGWLD